MFESIDVVEAPTERLLTKVLDRVDDDDVAVVDTPPGHERLLAKALERADAVVIPTRVGGVETARVEAVLDMVPKRMPTGLVIASARTFTRDYQDTVAMWVEAGVPVWGAVPERVTIAAGPDGWLSAEGLDSYREVWQRLRRARCGAAADRSRGGTLGVWMSDPSNSSSCSRSVLLLFGSKKLPELAKGMGQAAREFRSGLHDESDEKPDAPDAATATTERTPDTSS